MLIECAGNLYRKDNVKDLYRKKNLKYYVETFGHGLLYQWVPFNGLNLFCTKTGEIHEGNIASFLISRICSVNLVEVLHLLYPLSW